MVSRLNFSTSAEARVSILLYDALDFSTDRDDGGGQTRESLFRIASPSAAVAGIDPARFAHQTPTLAARSFSWRCGRTQPARGKSQARRKYSSVLEATM